MSFIIRPAVIKDTPVTLSFIQGLAKYEKLGSECVATIAELESTLFGSKQYAQVLLCESEGKAVGFALYFYNYSTFLAKPGIWLEDLFVNPDERGKGYGKALLMELIRIARENDFGRVEWSVLDWNTPSIEFYKSIGAKPMDEWTTFRFEI